MVALADRIEAYEALVEVVQECVRDGNATATLIVEDLSADEFDEIRAPLVHLRTKRERIGPHFIEYRLSEEVAL